MDKDKKNKKIIVMIVEDDNFLMRMYSTKLEMEGYATILAEDGAKALRLAEKEKPDIILLDILLPKMDGFEVLKSLKEDKSLKKIPVIMLTNLWQKEDVERGLKDGAEDFLIKAHFMPSEVIGKIKRYARVHHDS